MSITAKGSAETLQLSETAVSMALNNKVGADTTTRQRVSKTVREQGHDFPRTQEPKEPQIEKGTMSLVTFKKHGAVVADTPFFNQLAESIDLVCYQARYSLNTNYLCADNGLPRQLSSPSYCNGMVPLTTEMTMEDSKPFEKLGIPLVVLDTYFRDLEFDCVLISNFQGTYQATDFLIHKTKSQLGYLCSSYPIGNLQERTDDFYKAIRENGLSPSKFQILSFSPSMEEACEDMPGLSRSREELPCCYFADNDLIAAGAAGVIKEMSYVILRDVSIVGLNNIPLYIHIEPTLSTIYIPRQYMGQTAVSRLVQIIKSPDHYPARIEIRTKIINRKSVQGTVGRCR